MNRLAVIVTALTSLATPVSADQLPSGDAASGERAFRQCIACHVVTTDAGETVAGRNGRTGPNLWGIDGRVVGSVDGFRYASGLAALSEDSVQWDEDAFVSYVMDPIGWVREASGDSSLRSAMSFRVRSEEDARDLYAYLVSLGGPEQLSETE